MTLTVSIAERIGAVPKRTLVIGGFSNFLQQTLAPRLAAWGLKVEWHWETGEPIMPPAAPPRPRPTGPSAPDQELAPLPPVAAPRLAGFDALRALLK